MKTILSNVNKRTFFQFEIDPVFRNKLNELAQLDGLSASGVVRMLVNREHANRFNGHQSQVQETDDPNPKDEQYV